MIFLVPKVSVSQIFRLRSGRNRLLRTEVKFACSIAHYVTADSVPEVCSTTSGTRLQRTSECVTSGTRRDSSDFCLAADIYLDAYSNRHCGLLDRALDDILPSPRSHVYQRY